MKTGFRDQIFGNFDSDEFFDAGIDFKSSIGRGGKVFNITFEDLTFRNCNGPVKMSTIYYSSSHERNETSIAEFSDIKMRNLAGRGFRQAGCFIGTPEKPIFGLVFENILYREFQEFHFFEESPDPEVVDGILEPPIGINAEKCFV